MSIPRNHHFVSQCQIKNFFNKKEGKIYLYDIELDNFFSKRTTKTVFSEKDSNSRLVEGLIYHNYLERDLKNNFEDKFTSSFNELEKIIKGSKIINKTIHNQLLELAKYGIAGEIRPPENKRLTDQAIAKPLFEQILPHAAPRLRKELEELREAFSKTKYSNSIAYSDFAEKVLELMGEVFFEVYYINSNDFFILPDRPSFTQREKINEYFNPDIKEIAIVDIPLSSKIILHVESKKLRDGRDQIFELSNENSKFIDAVNIFMLQNCYKHVACEAEEYLKKLVKKATQNS